MPIEMPKSYEHASVESRLYAEWLEKGYFAAEDQSDKPPYCIVIPPPNVTGSLHIGHALTVTLEDILIRMKRMQGYNTLWVPGTDHAGIATQMVVERELAQEGKDRHALGRSAFLEEVWKWKDRYHARITEQIKVMGCSVDWDRERFTMDEGLSRAVREVFVRLYRDGLIYRANRLVNWSPGIHTVLSDLEVEHQTVEGSLWHIAYPVTGSDERLVVATTRPETMLGDTAVAVHPEDPRYQHLIGKTIDLPLTDRKIPIIGDDVLVDMSFGTGAVKVTPAHDFNDFETGRRHDLPMISVLDKDAKINDAAPAAYRGMDRFEAREAIVADLEAAGLMVKIEPHTLNVGYCQRTQVVVEPMLSMQWYVEAEPLAKRALDAVRNGETRFTSSEWEKTFYHWMENIQPWCISRQLWWGHQIPAWFCDDCDHITVTTEAPEACEGCQGTAIHQDEDVLDTWFSSGLWPFSTLGWPEKTPALETFYPNAVLETGFDILFFWVARMMMLGLYCLDEVPFRTVYMHPMVRDASGQKMSKTRNNVIDPLDITKESGADALRFTLAALVTQGHDLNFSMARLEGYRAFGNKLWNATRFVFMHLEEGEQVPALDPEQREGLTVADRWILHELNRCVRDVTEALEDYEFQDAANAIYQFMWSRYCDWYIELSKPTLREGGEAAARTKAVLMHVLDQGLRLLHPFMPFLTEELWQRLPITGREEPSLVIARWPEPVAAYDDAETAALLEQEIALITAIRTIRGENGIAHRQGVSIIVSTPDERLAQLVREAEPGLRALANVQSLEVGVALPRPAKSAVAIAGRCDLYLPLEGLIDLDAEITRLEKAVQKLDKEITGFERKLGNERFVQNAPPEVVETQRERLAAAQQERQTYLESIDQLR